MLLLFCLFVAAATVAETTGKATSCPSNELLTPCACEVDSWAGAVLFCQGVTSTELSNVLNGIPTDFYDSLTVENSMLGDLDEAVFGGNMFRELTLDSAGILSIQSDTFNKSRDSLVSLKITNNAKLTYFPFDNLEGYLALEYLYFTNNALSAAAGIPALPLLWTIHIDGNQLTELPQLPYLPDLSWLNLQNNQIASLQAGAFSRQPKLTSIYLNNNKITVIPTGSLVTVSNVRTIDLAGNLIQEVEAGSFDVWPDTVVTLNYNQMAVFSEATFASQLAFMYDGSGHFDLQGNPLECDCSIAWLTRRQDLLASVYNGVCMNGQTLEQLGSGDFVGCK